MSDKIDSELVREVFKMALQQRCPMPRFFIVIGVCSMLPMHIRSCLSAAGHRRHNLGDGNEAAEQRQQAERRLRAEKKWRIYEEFQQPDAKSGEILRKNSIFFRAADNHESFAGMGAGAVAAELARQTCF
jgi:hypothetical protein